MGAGDSVSSDGLSWAWKQPVPMASAKFVLIALADQMTTDLAFMAVSTIAKRTGLDRKTVMTSIARLAEWGFIEDTGEKRGRTGSVPVYRVLMNDGLFDNAPYPSGPKSGTGTKNGTASEAVPKTDSSGTVFPTKQYQKRDIDTQLTQELDPTHTPPAREADATAAAEPDVDANPRPTAPSLGAQATRAMIEAGMPATRVNPSHPELLAALEIVKPRELADVVREVISRGTGPPAMVYVIRTALGRHRDAAREPADAKQSSPTRQPSHRDSTPRSANARMLAAIKRRRAREAAGAAGVDTTGTVAAGAHG